MQIERNDLKEATKAGLISAEQAQQLWQFWQKGQENIPRFNFSHMLYYFGGMLAISAVTLFVTQAWDQLLGVNLFILSSCLFVLGLLLARHFLQKNLRIPAGIMSTFSLALVPLAIYNLQIMFGFLPIHGGHYTDFNSLVSWYWVPMEFATLMVGVIMLYYYRFPFLLFPISVILWYMSMDLFALLFQLPDSSWRPAFSVYFGLIVILWAIYMDFRDSNERQDYAFWLYIFGVLIFWGGMSCIQSTSEISKFFYCLINIGMVFTSVILNRRVFAIFGALGILGYLGHLSFSLFANSLGFPISLVFLGIIIIFAATYWPRVETKLIQYLHPYIPQKFLKRMRF